MKKESTKKHETVNKKNHLSGKYICSMVMIFLIITEFYIIVNHPKEWLWILMVGICIVVDNFLWISNFSSKNTKDTSKMQEFILNNTETELVQKVENIRKTEKAFYILSRKKFAEIDEKILRLEKAVVIISENVNKNKKSLENAFVQSMEDNRKVAKIIIAKNKENAEGYGNLKSDVIEKVELLENRLSKMEDTLLHPETFTKEETENNTLDSWEEFDQLFFHEEENQESDFIDSISETEFSKEEDEKLGIDEIEALMASL